jgi:methionyl-tRNA synthetase
MKKFYITTPIYYPNARPHVGSAYTTIVCDAIARYKRMCGYDVAFLTGTDEHGEKLQRAADAAGMPVEQFVAEKRELFKALWRTLGMGEFQSIESLDRRSTEPSTPPIKRLFVHTSQNTAHVKSVQWMIQQAKKAGYIEKKRYEGRYCVFDERYVSDSAEPVNCDICGRPAELISEENYFFTLSAFQNRLLKLYEEHPEFVLPDFRMNEVKSFVKSGLRDISISRRRLKWGIPWPDDDEQVVYVWYDALTSYLTGIGFRGGEKPAPEFETYWMGKDGPAEVVHMIGKDILRFHAVYWPAFLMAANDALPAAEQLPLPKTIFAHGWIYYEKDKMSKSKGNVVYPGPIVKAFEEFGAPGNDALRYYLLRDTPFGLDGSFSYEGLINRYNSDLANDLGNLANRCLSMVGLYREGRVPPKPAPSMADHYWDMEGMYQLFGTEFDRLNLSDALSGVGIRVSLANKNITDAKPWELAKSAAEDDREALDRTLYGAADLLRAASVLLYPVVPLGMERLWGQLGRTDELSSQRGDQLKPRDLEPGTKLGKPEPIFPRLKKDEILRRLHELTEEDRSAGVSPASNGGGQQDAGATPAGAAAVEEPLFSYEWITVRSRGRLPHWEVEGGTYFVTFALADSLPRSVLQAVELERIEIVETASREGRELTRAEQHALAKLHWDRIEGALDAGSGASHLARPEVAQLVADALKHFQGERYELIAWCIMPNHVHVVFRQLPGHPLEAILHSWKSFTAKAANTLLGESGEFWEREYYDHLVRDARDLDRIVRYVLENPVRANLEGWRWVWGSVENAATPHGGGQQDAGATPAGVSPAEGQALEEAKLQSEDQPLQDKKEKPTAGAVAPAPERTGGVQLPIGNPQSTISTISIDDFVKIDLRAGTILSAEPIPGATKLLKLQVDIGSEVRQVCAGIAEYYQPEVLIGKKVVLVANLQPRKLRGVESNGMVVAASVGEDGRPVLATFTEEVPNGSKLK